MKELQGETYSRERLANLSLAQIRKLRDQVGRSKKQMRVPPLVRQDRRNVLPLSYAQERLWFLDQLGLPGAAYNVRLAVRLLGDLNEGALEQSFAELVHRHESLRTRFGVQAGVPHQLIDPVVDFKLHRVDLSNVSDPQLRERQLSELRRGEHQHRFDLSADLLIRVMLVRVAGRESVLLVTMHHIVADGWSVGILVRDLSAMYSAYIGGRPSRLPQLKVQYADYAIWQRRWIKGEVLQSQLKYWTDQLAGAPLQLQLPTDRSRPAVESFRGGTLKFHLPAKLIKALEELARRDGGTLFMAFLAAYQLLLSRWTGQQDIVVGSPIAGRKNREVEELIGFFVNTLALRTEVAEDLTFRQLLERVKVGTLGAYANQDLPFEQLVMKLRPERNLTRQPIFQVMLSLQNFPEEQLELPELTWEWSSIEHETAHFDLTLYLYGAPDGCLGVFEYATDLFDLGTIERMARHLRALLEGIIADSDSPIHRLPMLGEAEKQQLLIEWNATATSLNEICVHEIFEEQVRRTPHAVAVVYEGESLTYAELNGRANQLARYLINRGVGPDQLVGVCIERSLGMVIGLLGILKAGGAYVPLDPTYPTERLTYMLEDAAPQLVLTQGELMGVLPDIKVEHILLDAKLKEIAGHIAGNVSATDLGMTVQNLVYVIYTSGSTGRPKGTEMPHRSMVNLIEWHRKCFGPFEGRRVLQFSALSFDVAFQEMFSTLCTGGTLVLLGEWLRRDARALTEFLITHSIETLFVPPLMLHSLAEYSDIISAARGTLQDIIVAGEQLRVTPEISNFFKRLNGCRLHNHYGPTETHVVTALTLTGDPDGWPPLPAIGSPISNTRIYVLDSRRQPVPVGVVGEIYIGGSGVARGYRARSDLTAGRFISDPFGADPNARLYKTGDLGRWRANGTLEYLGRNDDQVKIRGYRIELEEVEAQLARHDQVKEAAVIAREDSLGQKRLVAYVTSRDQHGPTVEKLREHLNGVLPEHMVPAAYVILKSLPLTPSGKLDRSALPAPNLGAYVSRDYEPPNGEVECILAGIWQALLHVDRVGRHDNFFELGGHSLLGVKLIATIAERFAVTLSAIAVFQYPTVQQMAKIVESLRYVSAVQSDSEGIEFEEGLL